MVKGEGLFLESCPEGSRFDGTERLRVNKTHSTVCIEIISVRGRLVSYCLFDNPEIRSAVVRVPRSPKFNNFYKMLSLGG